jgi:surface antigen
MRHADIQKVVPIILLAFAMSSCASMQQTYKENPKAVLGGVLGAGAGAGIAAAAGASPGVIVFSAVGGALIGGLIGKQLDNRDKQMAADAAARAFEQNRTGQASVWNNPESGHSGSITPTKTYQLANGQYCREYRQTITVGGEPQTSSGTACRQADGSWKIQS